MAPGSMALVFDLAVRGDANNSVGNNVSRTLVNRFTLKFAGEVLQNTNRYDLYLTFADFFLKAKERQNKVLKGIQSGNLNKHDILRDHDAFYPRVLAESLSFEIWLACADQVIVGTDPTSLGYDLTNGELDYEVVRNT